METVALEVFAVDMAKAVGFRRVEPTGPAGIQFGLYLPSYKECLTKYGALDDIFECQILNTSLFPWDFSYIHIHPGEYKEDSRIILAQYLPELPFSEDCRLSGPVALILWDGK